MVKLFDMILKLRYAYFFIFNCNEIENYFPPAKKTTKKRKPLAETQRSAFNVIFTFTFTRSAKWLIFDARIVVYRTSPENTQHDRSSLEFREEREIEYMRRLFAWNISIFSLNSCFSFHFISLHIPSFSVGICVSGLNIKCSIALKFRFAFEQHWTTTTTTTTT